ncbi:ABC transporter substrate-binding protein [Motiliproteus sp. MSK22-1]|uniref:ABC transporter substrate-binding protein n=1 Tax=Motiliproteus sp. MSK22-1 TaxID=1897630 RepID=UPI00097868A4|nr:ABC transporter substrate-binding protein [Motiliproteus sp. MSK22-1]OMH30268.1 ABC transporter permease [Motiliproteus sp. MSK22-1]
MGLKAILGASALALGVSMLGLTIPAQASDKHVAITQIVEHPALDACRNGVQDGLAAAGFKVGENLKWSYESAQGNPATAAQVAKKFAGEAPDVIVAISTPSAQTVAASARHIPLVFTAVTDPLGAKLVKNLDKPGKLITGITDLSPINKHVELVQQIVPGVKRLGVIYNPGETNSVTLVSMLHTEAKAHGLTVVEAAATKSGDVLAAARSLVGKADAIYIPLDNTVVSALEAVIKVAEQNDLPLISGDTDSVGRGSIAAVGFNYYDVGLQTGKMVARVLNGEKPGDIAVESVQKLELYLNPAAAERMGVKLSDELIASAKEIVK